MALEKSVLTYESIDNILRNHFKINILHAEKIPLGSANCYKIHTDGQKYFLKEFQSSFTTDSIVREAALVNFLSDKGFATSRFICNTNGQPFTVYKGHIICLEEFIDGHTYGYDNFPSELLIECAGTLGILHSVMKGYSLPIDMDKKWLSDFSPEKLSFQYSSLADIAKSRGEDKYSETIVSDLEYKSALAFRCSEYIRFFEGITYSPTHGDYQGCQLICENTKIKAVIDFSSARTLPAVWEIMRSFVQTSSSRATKKIDADRLCEYVAEYMKHSPLTKADLAAMPYVYLFQLARSRFGYPQYLTTDSEDRTGLLKFATWRTDICRELEENAGNISSALKSIT